jgi:hypothetical protein
MIQASGYAVWTKANVGSSQRRSYITVSPIEDRADGTFVKQVIIQNAINLRLTPIRDTKTIHSGPAQNSRGMYNVCPRVVHLLKLSTDCPKFKHTISFPTSERYCKTEHGEAALF